MVFTSTYHYFYPVSHPETANGIHYLKFHLPKHKVQMLQYKGLLFSPLFKKICLRSVKSMLFTMKCRKILNLTSMMTKLCKGNTT